jgi:MFS family permease
MKLQARLLLLSSYMWELGEGMLGPLFAVFTERVGGDILDITYAWAAFLIATGLCIIIVGRISDKVSKERLLVAGYALNAVFTFCYLFVSTPFQLLLVQAGLGIATALATPTWDALYEKYGDKKHPGFAWSLDTGVSDIVVGIAIIVGGIVLVTFSFTTLFIIMGCIQLVATGYLLPILWHKN